MNVFLRNLCEGKTKSEVNEVIMFFLHGDKVFKGIAYEKNVSMDWTWSWIDDDIMNFHGKMPKVHSMEVEYDDDHDEWSKFKIMNVL